MQLQYDEQKLQKVLQSLGLTVEDLQRVAKVEVPEEFYDDADFFTQVYIEHAEARRQRLINEVNEAYRQFSERQPNESPVILEDQHIYRLERMHRKEIERIHSQQKLLREAELKRELQDQKQRCSVENKNNFILQRRIANVERDQARMAKLLLIDQHRKEQKQILLAKMRNLELKQEAKQNQLSQEREKRQLMKEQLLTERLRQVKLNKHIQETQLIQRLRSRRQSYEQKLKELLPGLDSQLVAKSKTKSVDEHSVQQLKFGLIEDGICLAMERKNLSLQQKKRKFIQKHLRIDDSQFNQKRLERMNDLKKQTILSRVSKQDERVEQIKIQMDQIKKHRLQLQQRFIQEKQAISKEYKQLSNQSTDRSQEFPSLSKVYLTPQTTPLKKVPPKRKRRKSKFIQLLTTKDQQLQIANTDKSFCQSILSAIQQTNIHELQERLKSVQDKEDSIRLKLFTSCNFLQLFS